MTREFNFDGLIGPSHNYAGLAVGNRASQKHAQLASKPRTAALQGIEKMRTLIDLGYSQALSSTCATAHSYPSPAWLRR